ncbi:MAG: hypothetical protein FJX34_00220, partial [Alphaproteobacteria bacterium]|nr:hypothetical protein [Alphaproteobacteria bacterium]
MKGHKEQKDEDVIKADDISFDLRDEKTKQIPNWFTKVIQCTINAFQRQGFINLKLLADSGMAPLTELGKNPSVFVKGYPWRFAYQNSAIFFPLYLRDEFLREKDLSVPETSFFTAGAEAIIGSGIELMSVKKTLKQT